METVTLDQVHKAMVDVLGDVYKSDPEALSKLLCKRVKVSDAVAAHPDVAVNHDNMLGCLGLFNGVLSRLGTDKRVYALVDEENMDTLLGIQGTHK